MTEIPPTNQNPMAGKLDSNQRREAIELTRSRDIDGLAFDYVILKVENARLRAALLAVQSLGDQRIDPTLKDLPGKVAQIAREALK